jgi:hypothetical protein
VLLTGKGERREREDKRQEEGGEQKVRRRRGEGREGVGNSFKIDCCGWVLASECGVGGGSEGIEERI